jgi:hypothetical protein
LPCSAFMRNNTVRPSIRLGNATKKIYFHHQQSYYPPHFLNFDAWLLP